MNLPPPPAVVSGCPKTPAHRRAEENRRLVWTVMKGFRYLNADPERQEEAYGAGCLALVRAAESFDPGRGFTFGTYAGDCIRHALLNYLKVSDRQERIETVSLETPIGADGTSELADVTPDPQAEKPGAAIVSQAGFEAWISGLPLRQQEVLRALYLDGQGADEIAEAWGITRQGVHAVRAAALERIRRTMKLGRTQRAAEARRKAVDTARQASPGTVRDLRWGGRRAMA